MDKEKLQEIKDGFEKLPPKIQTWIMSDTFSNILLSIGEKHKLDLDDFNLLQYHVILVLMGIDKQEDFAQELSREIKLDPENIQMVAREIREKIFDELEVELNIVKPDDDLDLIEGTPNPRFTTLPENVQTLINNSDYETILYGLAKDRKLSIDQMEALDTITTDLMVGDINPVEFQRLMEVKVGLPKIEAKALVDEINEKVFKKIRAGFVSQTTKTEPVAPSQDDLDTLKSHGIEIVEEEKEAKPVAPKTTAIVEEKLELESGKKPDIHPMLAQKMTTKVVANSTRNEYGINNAPIAHKEEAPKASETPKSTYKPGQDPYKTPID